MRDCYCLPPVPTPLYAGVFTNEPKHQNMSCLIFKLKHVTQEEADEVKQLLADHNIAVYETDSGVFGTSVAGLWLHDVEQKNEAKALLAEYTLVRQQRVRAEYQRLRDRGEIETLWQRFKAKPVQLTLAAIAVGFILLFTVMPFFSF